MYFNIIADMLVILFARGPKLEDLQTEICGGVEGCPRHP
jgi:hypothetical protein